MKKLLRQHQKLLNGSEKAAHKLPKLQAEEKAAGKKICQVGIPAVEVTNR